MYIYIFSATSISIIYKLNQNNYKEERRSGTTGIGVTQKHLQIGKKWYEVVKGKETRTHFARSRSVIFNEIESK